MRTGGTAHCRERNKTGSTHVHYGRGIRQGQHMYTREERLDRDQLHVR